MDVDIDTDVFSMSKKDREISFIVSRNYLLKIINSTSNNDPEVVLNAILTQTIKDAEQTEHYEVCYILNEIKKLKN